MHVATTAVGQHSPGLICLTLSSHNWHKLIVFCMSFTLTHFYNNDFGMYLIMYGLLSYSLCDETIKLLTEKHKLQYTTRQ